MHREFTCRECGKVVIVTEPKDRRRSFFRITENSVRNVYLLKGDYLYE
jgi:hypothetical protein